MEQTMPFSQFCEILSSGRALTLADQPLVSRLTEEYPFFTLPASMMLEVKGLSDDDRSRFSAAVALNAPDMASLMKLIDPDGKKFASFYPPEPEQETPTTDDAIDTFLDQYGTMDRHEQDLLERLIFNPVPDYSLVLAREEESASDAPVSEQDRMLDAFLASQDAAVRELDRAVEEASQSHGQSPVVPDADAPLTESLARIYIGKGRYDKAYEIIYQLSLNFPKKSIYFADQLRFLKKLMYIQQVQETKGKTVKK